MLFRKPIEQSIAGLNAMTINAISQSELVVKMWMQFLPERGKLKRLQPEVNAGKEKIATRRESGKMTSAKLRDVFSHVPDWRKIQRLCCDWFTVNCLWDGHRRDRPQVFVWERCLAYSEFSYSNIAEKLQGILPCVHVVEVTVNVL